MTITKKWAAIAAGMTAAGALLSGCSDNKKAEKEPEQPKTLAEIWSEPPSAAHFNTQYYNVSKNTKVYGSADNEYEGAKPYITVKEGCVMRPFQEEAETTQAQGNFLPVGIVTDEGTYYGVARAKDLKPTSEAACKKPTVLNPSQP